MNALSLLSSDELIALTSEIKAILNLPFMGIKFSDLGGKNERSAIITVSIESKEQWENGYLENSKYARFHYEPNNNNELEQFTCTFSKKFRKARPVNIIDAAKKIKKYIDELPENNKNNS